MNQNLPEKNLPEIVHYLYLGDPDALTGDDCKRIRDHLSRLHAAVQTALELGWSDSVKNILADLRKEYKGVDEEPK